jgi:hypothetical protein
VVDPVHHLGYTVSEWRAAVTEYMFRSGVAGFVIETDERDRWSLSSGHHDHPTT